MPYFLKNSETGVEIEVPYLPDDYVFQEYESLIERDYSQDDLDLKLENNKVAKNLEIDSTTQEQIDQGFTYDSKVFSTSTNAQSNWLRLKILESNYTWPIDISTKDDNEYSLEQVDLSAFIEVFRAFIYDKLRVGRELKVEVADAVDQSELNSVVDNR